jgi:hypothetical protein
MISSSEKQGLKDPLTGQPAVDFMKESSFTSKLHRNAQEYQQCVIIVEKFFLQVANTSLTTKTMWSTGS